MDHCLVAEENGFCIHFFTVRLCAPWIPGVFLLHGHFDVASAKLSSVDMLEQFGIVVCPCSSWDSQTPL